MGQFCEKYACDYGKPEDSTKGSQRVHNLGKKARGACFSHGDYKQFSKLKNSIIYCDPPYENSSQRYLTEGMFNSKEFWCWVRTMAEDNLLFVSSYNAPKDFKCIWSKAHKLTGQQKNNKNKERVEKLFVYNI
jgi:DNA adenine methylase